MVEKPIEIYTFGNNRLVGNDKGNIKYVSAYAFVMTYGDYHRAFGNALGNHTANYTEIYSLIQALRHVKNKNLPIIAYSQSSYLVNFIRNNSYANNDRRGWVRKGKPVPNRELWQELREVMADFPNFKIYKVYYQTANVGLNWAKEIARENLARTEAGQAPITEL